MTTSEIFDSKNEWLAFRKSWSQFVNSPAAKPTYEPVQHQHLMDATGRLTRFWSKDHKIVSIAGKRKIKGCVRPTHVALYNVLRGKPLDRGFDKSSAKTLSEVTTYISQLVTYATNIHTKHDDKHQSFVNSELSVFGGAVTTEHLARVKL